MATSTTTATTSTTTPTTPTTTEQEAAVSWEGIWPGCEWPERLEDELDSLESDAFRVVLEGERVVLGSAASDGRHIARLSLERSDSCERFEVAL